VHAGQGWNDAVGKAHSPGHGCGDSVVTVTGDEAAHAAAGQAERCDRGNVKNFEHWRFVNLRQNSGSSEAAEHAAEPGVSAPERRGPVKGQRVLAEDVPLNHDGMVELGADQSGDGHGGQEDAHGNGDIAALEVGVAEEKAQG